MTSGFATGFSTAASAASVLEGAGSGQPRPKPGEKTASAARDFEALLLGQVLKSAHGDSGWLGTDDDDAANAAVGFSEEQLASAMASSGGFGLARLIESGIDNRQEAIDSASAAPRP